MANKSYLLLGEGDFTFSLDMCRYIASFVQKDNEESIGGETGETSSPNIPSSSTNPRHKSFSITCTGVDTLSELRDKYKDIEFILRNIRSCSTSATMKNKQQQVDDVYTMNMKHNTHTSAQVCVTTSILHGINAVDAEFNTENISNDTDAIICEESFDHVIFNHPHLGTEDAQLHSRFLQHFFYAANKRWMKPQTGILHLTLVQGQCARWKCIEGANKHGLVLLRRGEFVAPPPPPKDSKTDTTYYKLRRHQSGRSFANRRRMQQQSSNGRSSSNGGYCQNDSETLVFGRKCDYPGTIYASIGLLPWEIDEFTNTKVDDNKIETKAALSTKTCDQQQINDNNTTTSQHPCKHCSKYFKEQRSLKNHMISSHPYCDEVRLWNLEKVSKKKKSKKRKLKDDDGLQDDGGNEGGLKTTICTKTSNNDDAEKEGPPWICNMCKSQQQTEVSTRIFPHKQALLDHQRAKHIGAHVDIKPDWQRENNTAKSSSNDDGDTVNEEGSNSSKESCPICDHRPYTTEMDQLCHRLEFVPSSSAIASKIAQRTNRSDVQFNNSSCPVFKCSHCSKSFRELRAQLQHENFCSVADNINVKKV